jgi:hypothetical protein
MLLVKHPETYAPERRYIFDVILGEFLGLAWEGRTEPREDVEISVAEISDGQRLTVADGLFRTPEHDWLSERSLPSRPLSSCTLDRATINPTLVDPVLPVIYGHELANGSHCTQTETGLALGVDIFGSVFFQLSRYEEIALQVRDEHDRFSAGAALAIGEGFVGRPLVNEYVEVLWAALVRLWPRLQRRRREFSERLSHDVDWPLHRAGSPLRIAKTVIGDLLYRRDAGLALTRLQGALANVRGDPANDPYNTFDLIMDLSERRGLRSAFYFMAGKTDARFDGTYSLEDPWIRGLMGRIHKRGHELGLHPSYGSFRDASIISAEHLALVRTCQRLDIEQAEWGGRQHFLRWENPATWRAWEQAGLAYDSSLGFSQHRGFRCGTCFEYPVFDLVARKRLRLRERPLVVMDIALLTHTVASEDEKLAEIEALRSRCRLFGGEFTMLWHNSRLTSRRAKSLYTAALAGA